MAQALWLARAHSVLHTGDDGYCADKENCGDLPQMISGSIHGSRVDTETRGGRRLYFAFGSRVTLTRRVRAYDEIMLMPK